MPAIVFENAPKSAYDTPPVVRKPDLPGGVKFSIKFPLSDTFQGIGRPGKKGCRIKLQFYHH